MMMTLTYDTEFQRESRGQASRAIRDAFSHSGTRHINSTAVSWVYVRLIQPEYGQDIDKRLWTRVP